jgi:hypothetical protein
MVLIVLLIVIVVSGCAAQFLLTDARWRGLVFAVCAVVTFVVMLLWVLQVAGLYHGPLFR